ncbi:hypothetical protein ACFFRR_007192 [Megaselia abdita]
MKTVFKILMVLLFSAGCGWILLSSTLNGVHDICQQEAQVIRKKWYMEYIVDCMADHEFKVSQNTLNECQNKGHLSQYDRCLMDNGVHRESMASTLKCYYETPRFDDIRIIRLAKIEALNTRNTTPEVYSALMNCKAENPKDVITLRNCLSQHGNLIPIKKSESSKEEKVKVIEKCSSLVTKENLKMFQDSKKFDTNIVPYLKCVQENLKIIEDDRCFYISRFLEVNNDVSKELVRNCFNIAVGSERFDFLKFWKCYYL